MSVTAVRRIAAGAAASALGNAITLAGQVLLLPLFLWAWGAERYGQWLTLSAAVAYLSLLDFGMGMYVVNRLTAHYSSGEHQEYRRLVGTAIALYVVIATAATVLGGIAVWLVPGTDMISLTATGEWTARLVVVLLIAQMAWGIPRGLLLGLYRTAGEFHVSAMIWNGQHALALALTAAALTLGGTLLEVAAIQLIPVATTMAYVLYDLRHRRPEIPVVIGPLDWRLAASLLSPSLVFLVILLSLAFTIQGTVLVVSALFGAAAVALYVTVRTLVNTLRQIVGFLNHPTWPELIRLKARHDAPALRAAHRLLVKVCLAVTTSLAIFLHFSGSEIVAIWTAGRIQVDQTLLDLLLVLAVAQAPWISSSSFPLAFNLHRKIAGCYVVSGALGLAAAWFLGQRLGLAGVALGLLVADVLVCGTTIPRDVCRMLGDRTVAFWRDVGLRGLPVIVVQWLIAAGIGWLVTTPWVRMSLLVVALSSLLIGLGFRLWLNDTERVLVRRWFGEQPLVGALVKA